MNNFEKSVKEHFERKGYRVFVLDKDYKIINMVAENESERIAVKVNLSVFNTFLQFLKDFKKASDYFKCDKEILVSKKKLPKELYPFAEKYEVEIIYY